MEKNANKISMEYQRSLFLNTVISYVTHSKQVYSHSLSPLKNAKLMKCDGVLYELRKLKSIPSFSQTRGAVLAMKQKLFDVLPCEKNNSYQSSLDKYNNIIDFCSYKKEPVLSFT